MAYRDRECSTTMTPSVNRTLGSESSSLGFYPHDIEAPELSEDQRCHLLGQCIDINLFSWFIHTASPAIAPPPPSEGTDFGSQVPPTLSTPSLPLSVMAPGAFAIERQYAGSQPLPHPPPEVLPAARFAPKLTLPKPRSRSRGPHNSTLKTGYTRTDPSSKGNHD